MCVFAIVYFYEFVSIPQSISEYFIETINGILLYLLMIFESGAHIMANYSMMQY